MYGLMIAAAAAVFFSCSNFLGERSADVSDEEIAFQSPMLVYINTAISLYNNMFKIVGNDCHIYDLGTFSSDEAMSLCRIGNWGDDGLRQDILLHRWGAMNGLTKSSWDFLCGQAGKCNQSIDKLQTSVEKQPNVGYFRVYLEEVRMVRVFLYYELLGSFACALSITSHTTLMSEVKQSERSVISSFIRSELGGALPYLSGNRSNQEGEYYGYITKSVAYMILTKLALNAEIYADDNWTDSNHPGEKNTEFIVDGKEMNAWEVTIAYVDKLEALGYKLQGDPPGNFAVANETSVENTFVVPMNLVVYPDTRDYDLVRTHHYDYTVTYGQSGWNGSHAAVRMVSAFKFGTTDEDSRYELAYFTGEVTDPDGRVIYTGQDGQKVPLGYEPSAPKVYMDTSDGLLVKIAGARMTKYEFNQDTQDDGNLHRNDYVTLRFASVLLIEAEAKIRLGQNGDGEVNQVRNRIDAESLQNVTLDTLLNEYMLELVQKGVRRQDLIRFGKFTEATADRYADVGHFTSSLDYQEDKTGCTMVFSIYADIFSLDFNLTQNPRY